MTDMLSENKFPDIIPDDADTMTTEMQLDSLLQEIRGDEQDLELMIRDVSETTKLVKTKLDVYLQPGSANHSIFFNGVPDIIQAYSRLAGITIDARFKSAGLKKARAKIILDRMAGKANAEDELTFESLMGGSK